jgi:thioesterase domain-containing protein
MRDMVGPGPYYLIGFSFGGMLAYEMAQQLVACGEEQPFIGMIDATEMSYLKRQAKQKPPVDRAGDLYSRLRRRFAEAFERPDTFAYIREKIESRAMRSLYSLTSRTGVSMPRQMQRPYHVNWFAAINYEPRPFDGHVALFKATGHFWEPGMPEDLGWGDLVRQGIEMVDIPGDHVSLFVEPSVSILGAELCRSMEAFASRSVIAAG